jgi:hypothetical protein
MIPVVTGNEADLTPLFVPYLSIADKIKHEVEKALV